MIYQDLKDCQNYLSNIQAIDYFLAKEVTAFLDNDDSDIFHLLIALSVSYRQGHSCLDLAEVASQRLWCDTELGITKTGYIFSNFAKLKYKIENLYFDKESPLAYQFSCLYLTRLWVYENEIAEIISQKLKVDLNHLNISKSKEILKNLFSKVATIDYQKIAVANSLIRGFSVISGGPGTGKTTIVQKLLKALECLNLEFKLNVQILAPTGKAANRLMESLNIDDFNSNVEIMTVHRFLGIRSNSIQLKYSKESPANCDILIIDEASMLDMHLCVKILRAIKSNCKLIFLGDVNQLPSVEAGNLLTEFSRIKSSEESINETKKIIGQLTNLHDFKLVSEFIVHLQKNYRSNEEIIEFSRMLINKDCQRFYNKIDNYRSINFNQLSELDVILNNFVNKYYSKLSVSENISEAFKVLKSFRILLANKNTQMGTDIFNKKIATILGKQNINYDGRPIMVTENNYTLGVFNGDVGLVYNQVAYFESSEDEFKKINISLLPKHETAYAMTIHKAQGSEFNEVMIVLPKKINKILSSKLLYTGVTRAKSAVSIISNKEIWEYAIANNPARFSNISKLVNS